MKTAVVTGISSGIGKTIVEQLLTDGWKVYGVSRSESNIVAKQFVWLRCDLSSPEQIEAVATAVTESTIDLFISNAGFVEVEKASAVTPESYMRTFSVNVLAPMLLVAGLYDKLQQALIISVSSDSDRVPDADIALYCSSKAANTLYFDSLAQELKEAKVYVLLPDYVDTPMLRNIVGDDRTFDWDATVKPSEIAQLVIDLAAGRATAESGANIIVATEALKDAFEGGEKLYGFNTDTKSLARL